MIELCPKTDWPDSGRSNAKRRGRAPSASQRNRVGYGEGIDLRGCWSSRYSLSSSADDGGVGHAGTARRGGAGGGHGTYAHIGRLPNPENDAGRTCPPRESNASGVSSRLQVKERKPAGLLIVVLFAVNGDSFAGWTIHCWATRRCGRSGATTNTTTAQNPATVEAGYG